MTDEEFMQRLEEQSPEAAAQMKADAERMGVSVLELSEMMINHAFAAMTGFMAQTDKPN